MIIAGILPVFHITGELTLSYLGAAGVHESFFDTLTIEVENSDAVVMQAEKNGYNINVFSKTLVSVSFDELSTPEDIEFLWKIFNKESDLNTQNNE